MLIGVPLETAAGETRVALESTNIVPLPAVQRNADLAESIESLLGIDAQVGIVFFGQSIRVTHRRAIRHFFPAVAGIYNKRKAG